MTLVLGGTFDPPHNGHVALLEAAKSAFDADRALVLVVASPGHRQVRSPVDVRLALARLAFPHDTVEVDEHPRTIDMLRARQLDDPVLVIGSDELNDFPTWKEPESVLELARLAVGARPGFEVSSVDDRVIAFEITPQPVSSTDIRRRIAAGEPIDGLVPAAILGNEYFRYDEAARALVGEDSGETYRVGQHLELKLVEANPASGSLRFELPEGKFAGSPRITQRRDRVRTGKRGRPPNIRHRGRR